MKGRILAATDGNVAANGALRLAALLEQRLDTGVEVVSVWQSIPVVGLGSADLIAPAHLQWEALGAADQLRRVQRQLADLGLASRGWPIRQAAGAAAPNIVRMAGEGRAPLIVLGHGKHDLLDRWFGSETALQVMRLAHVPVLAVPEEFTRLPRTALVAVDFSEFSREAALALMDLLEPGGDVHLVHVVWKPIQEVPWVGGEDWIAEHGRRAAAELEKVAGILKETAEMRVHTHLRTGESAAREILRLAEEIDAELIAAGSHGMGFLGRILMGSVSSRIVRGAHCAVLVSPPRVPAEIQRSPRHPEIE